MGASATRTLRLLVAALLLTACPSAAPDPPSSPTGSADPSVVASPTAPGTGGSLKYGLSAEPSTLDPAAIGQVEDLEVVTALFRSLTRVAPDGSVQPAAATSWEPNEDASSYTFQLREGARFHDGTPVTAGDVVRAWNRLFAGAPVTVAPHAYHLAEVVGFDAALAGDGPLRGVRALDELTLQVDLVAPYEGFEAVVAHPSLAPVPLVAEEDPEGWREQPVGNGPFRMAEPWQHDQFIRVVRVDDHLPTAAHLDEVVFRISPGADGAATSYAEFEAGRLQVAEVPGPRLDEARRAHGSSADGYRGPGVIDGASATTYYFGFATDAPPYDDPEVRRALSLLIDRAGLAADLFEDTRSPATSLVPPSIPGHAADACTTCAFDPARARTLLEGRDVGTITLSIDDLPGQRAVAERVRFDIQAATGLQVEIVERSFSDHLDAIRSGEAQFFRLGWPADHPAADNVLRPLLHSSAAGDTNLSGFVNQEVDALLDRARRTRDVAGRIDLWRQAERLALDLVPITPVVHYRLSRVAAPEVAGLRFTPFGWADLSDVRLRS